MSGVELSKLWQGVELSKLWQGDLSITIVYCIKMPKDRRSRSASFERRTRASPYASNSTYFESQSKSPPFASSSSAIGPMETVESAKELKEWEDVRCPVCMEHPHNAVLLVCSSNDKGCRPFMCDTSYRHSNCLDQYRKAFSLSKSPEDMANEQPIKFSCPLCRGQISAWTVVEPARCYMNAKTRNCSNESCGFSGTYEELRKHARKEHPSVRPSEVDPVRQQDWRRMEQRRDLGDIFSMLQSSITREGDSIRITEDPEEASGSASSIMVFLVVRVQPVGRISGRSSRLRTSSARSHSEHTSRAERGREMILWREELSDAVAPATQSLDGTDATDQSHGQPEEDNGDNQQNQQDRWRHFWMSDDDLL